MTFNHETTQIDSALARFRAEEAKLYRGDGSRVYGDEEHAERVEELLEGFDRTRENALAAAQRAVGEANRTLALKHRDPTDALSEDELKAANAKRAFVREDCELMPLSELADRVKAVMATDDKVGMFLYSRYSHQRVAGETMIQDEGGLGAEETAHLVELTGALSGLDKALADPKVERRLSEAKETLAGAQKLKLHAQSRRGEADGTEERVRQQALASNAALL